MKRFIGILLCLTTFMSAMSSNVYAYNEDDLMIKEVKLVKVVRGYGNNHIIYTVNGREYDSLTTNPALNRDAYAAMSSSDKEALIGVFWNKKNKDRQFGKDGGEMISEFNRATNGMNAIADAYALNVEKNLCAPLYHFYGDAENEPKYWYKKELADLLTIEWGTDAAQILSLYTDTPQGEIFAQKYMTIEAYMRAGSVYYDKLVNIKTQMATYALKGTLLDGFNLVRTTFFAPAASSQLGGIIFDGFNTSVDYLDYMTGFVADKLNMRSQGVVTEFTSKCFNSSKYGVGNALTLINDCKPLAQEYYKQAEYAHAYAVQLRDELLAEAPSVLADIEADKEAKRIEDERAAAQEYFERTRKENNISNSVTEAESDIESYVYINDEPNPLYAAETELERIKARYDEWENDTNQAIDSFAQGFDFDGNDGTGWHYWYDNYSYKTYSDGMYDIDTSDPNNYIGYEVYLDSSLEWEDMEKDITPAKLSKIHSLIPKEQGYYDEVLEKLEAYYTAVDEFVAERQALLVEIAEDAKGLDEEVGTIAEGYISAEKYIMNTRNAPDVLSRIYSISTGLDYDQITSYDQAERVINAKKDSIQERYDTLQKKYNDYKQELEFAFDSYRKMQADYQLAWDKCADILNEMENLADNGFPDYVYTQNSGTSYFFDDDYSDLGGTSNDVLLRKIANARGTSGGVKHFFKTQASVLEEKYNKFYELNTKFDGYYSFVKDYLKQMQQLEQTFVSGEYLADRGIALGNYRPVLELMAESAVIHDEDIDYYSYAPWGDDEAARYDTLVYTNSAFNTYALDTERMMIISAARALMTDFQGASYMHTDCTEKLDAVKANYGNILRSIKNGKSSQVIDEYIFPLQDSYNILLNGSYSKGDVDTDDNGKTLSEEIYGTNGVLTKFDALLNDKNAVNSYIPVTGIEDTTGSSELSLSVGENAELSANVLPLDATYKGIIWKSLTPDVAGVDENGVVTAYASGNAEIIAIAEDYECSPYEKTVAGVNIKNYKYNSDYVLRYSINVDGAEYSDVSYLPSSVYSPEEISACQYSWLNYGTASSPEYFKVSEDGKSITTSYKPAAGSVDTVLLELYDENGEKLAESKYSNIDYDGTPCVLNANATAKAYRAIVTVYYDDDCTEYLGEILNEPLYNGTDHIKGDINFDKAVNDTDAKILLKFISGIEKPTSIQRFVSDVNEDGNIDILDVMAILNKTI